MYRKLVCRNRRSAKLYIVMKCEYRWYFGHK